MSERRRNALNSEGPSADIPDMNVTPQSGFTLLELLVALAVAAILLGIGAPEMSAAIREGRIGARHNALVGSLYLARSEAIKGSVVVTLCARASDTGCGESWENGWLVFVDGDTPASVDDDDTVLHVEASRGEGITIRTLGSSDRSATSATARDHIRFRPDGSTDWMGGSFVLCDERGTTDARVVNMVLTGDARRGRKSATGDVPLNVFGLPITCPAV